MKAITVAAVALSLAFTGAVTAHAAGQPQVPGESHNQTSAKGVMQTKRQLDVKKYQRPLPQTAANQTEQGAMPGQTGAGPRGTKVGPLTPPGQPKQPKMSETGVPPRGTKVGPSTGSSPTHQTQ